MISHYPPPYKPYNRKRFKPFREALEHAAEYAIMHRGQFSVYCRGDTFHVRFTPKALSRRKARHKPFQVPGMSLMCIVERYTAGIAKLHFVDGHHEWLRFNGKQIALMQQRVESGDDS